MVKKLNRPWPEYDRQSALSWWGGNSESGTAETADHERVIAQMVDEKFLEDPGNRHHSIVGNIRGRYAQYIKRN